jgi:uncharacterized protein
MNVSNWRSWVAWGGGIGLLISVTGFVSKYLNAQPLLPAGFSFALLNVLVVAPVFEELVMRGAILGNLQGGSSFLTANALTALMFTVLHLPGWYFTGRLVDSLTAPTGGALSMFVLGLLFGYAVRRGESVGGGMIANSLNNLASLR